MEAPLGACDLRITFTITLWCFDPSMTLQWVFQTKKKRKKNEWERMNQLCHDVIHHPTPRRYVLSEQHTTMTVLSDQQEPHRGKSSLPLVHIERWSNHFTNPKIESLYQGYCAQHSFHRARLLVGAIVVIHGGLSIPFAVIESSHPDGLDLLPRSFDQLGEWLQWLYLLVAVPFILTLGSTFRRRWKRWVCATILTFVTGLVIWLSYQAESNSRDFDHAMTQSLACTVDVVLTAEDRSYLNGLNVPTFVQRRNRHLYTGFTSVSAALVTVIGSTFAVAVRLDFLHVVLICTVTLVSKVAVMTVYAIQIHFGLLVLVGIISTLLGLSCYYADRTARRAFASKLRVERENEQLELALHFAEEALRNDAARESERQAVEASGLELLLANDRIAFESLQLVKVIGRGGMGEVILAQYLGCQVVCKRVRREAISVKTIQSFKEEIELISCLRHPNIVQFIGASWDNASNICMVLEYLENGDLRSVLHSAIGQRFTWSDPLLKIALDAGQGMLYLHSQKNPVVHRDLKSGNLLCSGTYGCKVSDFGLSKRKMAVDALTTVVGTPFWLAPEVIRNESYGKPADVYSFGIVLTELETRKSPYHDAQDTSLKVMMRVASTEQLRPTLPHECLPELKKLILDCLHDQPAMRPTFEEILTRLQSSVRMELIGHDEKPAIERRALLQKIKHDSDELDQKPPGAPIIDARRQLFQRQKASNLMAKVILQMDDEDSSSSSSSASVGEHEHEEK